MIIMQDEDGRKCDERCYDAKHMRCNCICICGGKNHGLGLQHALASVEDGGEVEEAEEAEEEDDFSRLANAIMHVEFEGEQ